MINEYYHTNRCLYRSDQCIIYLSLMLLGVVLALPWNIVVSALLQDHQDKRLIVAALCGHMVYAVGSVIFVCLRPPSLRFKNCITTSLILVTIILTIFLTPVNRLVPISLLFCVVAKLNVEVFNLLGVLDLSILSAPIVGMQLSSLASLQAFKYNSVIVYIIFIQMLIVLFGCTVRIMLFKGLLRQARPLHLRLRRSDITTRTRHFYSSLTNNWVNY